MLNKESIKNKLIAVAFVLIGIISVGEDGDITALIFLTLLAVPLFFAKTGSEYPEDETADDEKIIKLEDRRNATNRENETFRQSARGFNIRN